MHKEITDHMPELHHELSLPEQFPNSASSREVNSCLSTPRTEFLQMSPLPAQTQSGPHPRGAKDSPQQGTAAARGAPAFLESGSTKKNSSNTKNED